MRELGERGRISTERSLVKDTEDITIERSEKVCLFEKIVAKVDMYTLRVMDSELQEMGEKSRISIDRLQERHTKRNSKAE